MKRRLLKEGVEGVQEIASSLPPHESEAAKEGFIDFATLHARIPVCERTLREWIRKGAIPSVRLSNHRRFLLWWPNVRDALLRKERAAY